MKENQITTCVWLMCIVECVCYRCIRHDNQKPRYSCFGSSSTQREQAGRVCMRGMYYFVMGTDLCVSVFHYTLLIPPLKQEMG